MAFAEKSELASSPSSVMAGVLSPLEAAVSERLLRERAGELTSLGQLSLVSQRRAEECPICCVPACEQAYPLPALPQGAYACAHAICRDCIERMLIAACESSEPSRAMRCPFCRAKEVCQADLPVPPWYRAVLSRRAVVEARAHAERRCRENALAAYQMATAHAASNISALQRLVFSSGASERLQQALIRGSGSAAGSEDGIFNFEDFEEESEEEEVEEEARSGGSGASGGLEVMSVAEAELLYEAELEAEASVSAEGLTLRGSPPSDRLSEFLRRVGAATTALEH
ncbi:hypothetical protein EMIHUDRAFT_438157 [Emiliania huxleyi CCMP1516]|uniref:RING-type domain-containing protein n=2 Tax=Emiliania huxleyi TaxID=2903 RepID=A0A0D3ICL7_EMIH1|nr:hypothetical protein EMIHUDRAFT_438157 [Emiliania huxleyi CCMP1516]EOD09002.1 hypothetical protein EMIHUDRAFT_438157 [Emiliania huxleyi CCMP1516]|eukprot:XP_005761431.1 hypothetical protein EMIHUDRAFT_438157 [Emiliania huxleyi CCMP1516]